MVKIKIKVLPHTRYSKKKKKRYKVKKYSRKKRKKGYKLKIDKKPIIIKKYIVRDINGHIITTTKNPVIFRKEHEKRML